MNEAQSEFIEIHQLQVGMFIELEIGWMSHPFPKGSFKITSEKQISVIQGLGLKRIKYVRAKSDLTPEFHNPDENVAKPVAILGIVATEDNDAANDKSVQLQKHRKRLIEAQQSDLDQCERRYALAILEQKSIISLANSKPHEAMTQCLGLINQLVGDMLDEGESTIRLLSEGMGEKASIHPVNVTIISLLLGKSLGLSNSDLIDLGMGAFLHDIGKTQLQDRVRWVDDNFSSTEYKLYQEHVGLGVALGKRMGLAESALQTIAQHHELADGSGFPARLKGDSISTAAKILGLVNRYENLCNPSRLAAAITPHEALSLIFAQLKHRFDSVTLSAFIRMMGVYPPGSIVQLVDDRFAIVVSVNSSRPLKPRVLVFDPQVPRHEALILDLEKSPNLGIRRSLKPVNLNREAMEYLAPRQRICYFFDKKTEPPSTEVPA